MTELNSTVDSMPLRITLDNMKDWKFNVITSLDEGSKQNTQKAAFGGSSPGGGDGSEFEMIKEVLLDTNVWLLGTTGVVSILHMIFETLAFKNDIVSCLDYSVPALTRSVPLAQQERCRWDIRPVYSGRGLHAISRLALSTRQQRKYVVDDSR